MLDDLGYIFRLELAVHLAVDDGDRRKTAAPEAAHRFDREEPVGSRRVETDAELALELLDEIVAASEVASRAEADLDDVLAGLLQLEEIVECDHAVDLRQRHVKHLRYLDRNVARNVAVGLLNLVKHHDQIARL